MRLLAPTKLQDGDRVYHVSDTLTLNSAVRLFGNTANTTRAGFSLNLPIKIGTDVTGLTLTNAGTCALKVSITKDTVVSHAIGAQSTGYYCSGSIISHEHGMLNIDYYFPAISTDYAGCMAMLALPSTNPTIITFT